MPDAATTLAIPVLLLLHMPPVVASLSRVASPTQTAVTPLIEEGEGLTVTIAATVQVPIV
jgi:hypothetical protein